MAMYYYASKISAIACGTRCRQTVLQKSRGQRDRDKNHHHNHTQQLHHHHPHHNNRHHAGSYGTDCTTDTDDELESDGICIRLQTRSDNNEFNGSDSGMASDGRIYVTNTNDNGTTETSVSTLVAAANGTTNISSGINNNTDGIRYRRRYSEQLDAYDIELGFQKFEVSSTNTTKNSINGYSLGYTNLANSDLVQYDVPKNTHKRSQCDVNFESSVLGSGGIMYINGRIVSGPLESLVDVLVPKNIIDLDKEFIFSFLLSSRLYLRPHELLGKLLSSVPDSESLESLVALLAEWTNKFPYDYRDERMMSHVKHIVARCSNTRLEAIVSEILSALLKRLTDLERHEEELRSCQTSNNVAVTATIATSAAAATTTEKCDVKLFECPTSTQYAQILCRIEKKLAKHIGPEEFVQCSSNVLLDKQKKWDQPSSSGGPPGVQDPKKTCNLETYLDWSARLRLFVCNEILQCGGIQERSRCVELWSGVAQYCLLVGNYNSATAILETLESPPIARLKITWSKLQVTCQQLDCMQRHAEGHGNLWHKQAIVLNENHHQQQLYEQQRQQQQHQQQQHQQMLQQKTDINLALANQLILSTSSSTATNVTTLTDTTTTTTAEVEVETETSSTVLSAVSHEESGLATATTSPSYGSSITKGAITASTPLSSSPTPPQLQLPQTTEDVAQKTSPNISPNVHLQTPSTNALNSFTVIPSAHTVTTAKASSSSASKPNDWVVIPVFADIVKLALAGREDCLQRLPNGHININAFDRMAAIVGAFTKHMQSVKTTDTPTAAVASPPTPVTISSATTATAMPALQPSTNSIAIATPAGEYEMFCRHMQKITKLSENDLMMASFDCEEPNNAEKLMYDLN
ncbi:uncharacterized protein LOC111691225 isoform X2 [Lucilia cuprina]|uniref:uncharacterized protein LOC111691225 isoform X2 n=1 Tax=Lucilia cuprina TaxID=7375 RepID=UPI001F064D93|nr:uncharacterized protein LOC111691225 isoform X2 [Lucilia cuprina]